MTERELLVDIHRMLVRINRRDREMDPVLEGLAQDEATLAAIAPQLATAVETVVTDLEGLEKKPSIEPAEVQALREKFEQDIASVKQSAESAEAGASGAQGPTGASGASGASGAPE